MDAAGAAHGKLRRAGARGDPAEDHRCARRVNEGSARAEERQHLLPVVSRVRGGRVWAWYGVGGEVVSAARVKQAGSSFVVTEHVAFGVVLLQKADAGGGECW
jgi:hypothetical protein